MMTRYFYVILSLLFLGSVAACSPATAIPAEQTPTSPPAAVEPYHPLNTRTGVGVIDNVIETVARGDQEALAALIEFTQAPCTHADGLGGPPKCREDEEEGTIFEVLPFLGGEGSFLRRDEMENWSGLTSTGIYAVYEVNAAVITAEQYYPIGNYLILFAGEDNQPAVALRIGERGIVRVDYIFDTSPESLRAMVEREASTVILAPRS